MREAGWNPQCVQGVGLEADGGVLAEARGASAQVDDDVVHGAPDDTHELALRLLHLVVQAAQRAARREAEVILYERQADACIAVGPFVPRLEKGAARVAEDPRLKQQDFREDERRDLHQSTRPLTIARR